MGKFQKGHVKLGGRRPGSRNKGTTLKEILDAHKFEPVAEILKTLPELDAKERVAACIDMLPYLFVKKQSIETGVDPETLERLEEMGGKSEEELLAIVRDLPHTKPISTEGE